MRTFFIGLLLLFSVNVYAQANLPDVTDNIISIIQNDTILEYGLFAYEYEVEHDAIKYPDSLIAHLDYELFEKFPELYPNQNIEYIPYDLCHLNIQVPGHGSVPKHEVTYTKDSIDYPLCFYVLDIGNDSIQINYRIRLKLVWR